MEKSYKKMAGTSAVFVFADYEGPSPVERDGMVWSGEELHTKDIPASLISQPAMANALALEGLEDYDPPRHGDARYVESLGVLLVYLDSAKAWVQVE